MRFAFVAAALFGFVAYGHAGSKGQAPAPVVAKKGQDAAPAKGQDAGKGEQPAVQLARIGKVKWKRRPVVIAECPACAK